MRARIFASALLLFSVLPYSGIAAADYEDGPLPPGMKGRILNISGEITDIGGGAKSAGSAIQNTGAAPVSIAPSVQELATTGAGLTTKDTVPQNTGAAPTSIGSSVQELATTGSGITAKETGQSIVISMQAELLFDFDRADLRPTAVATLQKIAQFIASRAKQGVLIEGHTDAKGKIPYNQKLSLARAESVRRWFVERGALTSVEFTTVGFGASKPVAPNKTTDGRDDPVGRQKNRRVEITIAKK